MDRHISFIIDAESVLHATPAPAGSPTQPSPMNPAHCFALGAELAKPGDSLLLRATPLSFRGEDALMLHSVTVDGTAISPPQLQVREVSLPVPDLSDPLQVGTQTVTDHAWACQLSATGPCAITLGIALIARDCTPKGFFTATVQLAFKQ